MESFGADPDGISGSFCPAALYRFSGAAGRSERTMAGRAESEVKMPTIQATSIWKKNYFKKLSREWIQTGKI